MTHTGNELETHINDLLDRMLTRDCADAVLVPLRVPGGHGVVQSLVTDPVLLQDARPLAMVMPVNSASIISDMTKITPSQKRIAVVLKPCEIRALVELVKLKQASLENIIVVGVDCPGTYSVTDYKGIAGGGEEPVNRFLVNAPQAKDDENLRPACLVCEFPVPENSDVVVEIYGSDLKSPLFMASSEAGGEVLEKAGIEVHGVLPGREEAVSELVQRRLVRWNAMSEATRKDVAGLDNLLLFLESCINCHNCMDVCPVCYCRECFFDSPTFDYESGKYLSWARRKGAIKMPADTLLFHLTRLNHMSTSCVGCGMCEQACPSRIELMRLYKTVGYKAQKLFDYVAGRSPDDDLPLLTFREDELEPRR